MQKLVKMLQVFLLLFSGCDREQKTSFEFFELRIANTSYAQHPCFILRGSTFEAFRSITRFNLFFSNVCTYPVE